MNKTIYVRDEDVPVWDRAREIAGDKLSPVLMDGLKRYIADNEAEVKGFERIEVRYSDSDAQWLPKAKAFFGRWIYPPSDPFSWRESKGTQCHCAVAITAKGNAVFYSWKSNGEDDHWGDQFAVFPSLEQAAFERRLNLAACKAIEKLGVPIDELDI